DGGTARESSSHTITCHHLIPDNPGYCGVIGDTAEQLVTQQQMMNGETPLASSVHKYPQGVN
ncbi:MAG: hypothetical protein LBE86_12410, partial [Gemmobacter sp.]|nr:hypothetical protein [Gemmobacter sp.]